MFSEHSENVFTIKFIKTQTTVITMIDTTIVKMNKASDKICSINYLRFSSMTSEMSFSAAQSLHKMKSIFHESIVKNLQNIEDIKTFLTFMTEQYV